MLERPYLLFLGDVDDELSAKTARGILDWRKRWCVGQHRLEGCTVDLGLPDMAIEEATRAGARTMVVGVANSGGVLPDHWVDDLVEAAAAGLDIASGLHMRLADDERIATAARKHGITLHDVRHPRRRFETGKGTPRHGRRLLTVGTDCSCGKMYTTLALEAAMQAKGMDANFRATGQTGILIAGEGVAIDAVVADFISGAAEWLTPEADAAHWDVVEGQGSLFHPSFAGVSLGLLHGSQPTALVLCHEPTRTHMRGLPDRALPDLATCLEANLTAARLTSPDVRTIGVAVNTKALGEDEARRALAHAEAETGLPAADPMRSLEGHELDRLLQQLRP